MVHEYPEQLLANDHSLWKSVKKYYQFGMLRHPHKKSNRVRYNKACEKLAEIHSNPWYGQ